MQVCLINKVFLCLFLSTHADNMKFFWRCFHQFRSGSLNENTKKHFRSETKMVIKWIVFISRLLILIKRYHQTCALLISAVHSVLPCPLCRCFLIIFVIRSKEFQSISIESMLGVRIRQQRT